ncbi:MAG TPA: glutamate--tRNA ligase, partial [Ignavibacteriaceae bacterium]|nr:glutamate--tRNA ligase [Ignavibacteriaceae bacterium]
ESLDWIGLKYEEGPYVGGDNDPYLQSERLEIYREYAQKLIQEKKGYYCFCTPERLNKLREEQQKSGLQSMYDKHCLKLSSETVSEKLKKGEQHVIRLNVQPHQIISFSDVIRDNVEFSSDTVDDQVLIKSDGYPTYHLANVVDDHLMRITHVIRGEEWLSSTPKHILLYNYFGWELPVFAHLPLLLNPDRSKLSKRQGDVAVEDYRKKGYLMEALINFVALLGWTAGDHQEFYLIDELIEKFSLERVNQSGAIFNIEKLNWLNAEHLRRKSSAEILQMLKDELKNSKYNTAEYHDEYLLLIVEAMKERVSFIKDYLEKAFYFFEEPANYDEKMIQKNWNIETPEYLKLLAENLKNFLNPGKNDFETALRSTAEKLNVSPSILIHPLRLALTGMGTGPGIFDILFILGKEKSIKRIFTAIDKIKKD